MRASGTNLLAWTAAAVFGVGSARSAIPATATGVAAPTTTINNTSTHAGAGLAASAVAADRAPSAGCDAGAARILRLADRRLSLMPAVAAWKWQHHAAVTAPAREQAVIHHSGELARPLGLPAPGVEQLFALQVRVARDEEARLQRHWRARGFDYHGAAPSLTAVLRPQLDDITAQLLMALSAALPELGRPDFVGHETPCAVRMLRAEGWSDADRTELLRDLHAIGTVASRPPDLR
jgi:chorismate mutase-like protein